MSALENKHALIPVREGCLGQKLFSKDTPDGFIYGLLGSPPLGKLWKHKFRFIVGVQNDRYQVSVNLASLAGCPVHFAITPGLRVVPQEKIAQTSVVAKILKRPIQNTKTNGFLLMRAGCRTPGDTLSKVSLALWMAERKVEQTAHTEWTVRL